MRVFHDIQPGYFCSNGRKQKQPPFQYLTCRCAPLSDINQDRCQ
jgi:hypothetical protein